VRLAAPDRATAEAQVDEMCRRLLANPVLEDYRFTLEAVEAEAPTGAPPADG
jgi:phosphoribosylformylglycinamidine synthase PurS subunit